jgi:UDP-glucuronate decarboxylase
MRKKIIVAGGAGFLGRHLCKKLLNRGHYVICIDNLVSSNINNIVEFISNDNFTFYCHDITKPIELNNIDEIYNLACIASPDLYKLKSIETLSTCFIGTKNLLDLAVSNNAKYLFTSTSEVYGDPIVHPQPEEYYGNVNTVGERSCYDEGKRVAETLVYEYNKKYNLDTKIVRIFNTYGPYMNINDGRVITNFIKKILNNEKIQIYGSGNQTRSFCYVDDLIDGILNMMDSKEKGPINIGNPNCEFTINKLVNVFEKILNIKLEVEHLEGTENDPQQRKPIIEKAMEKLNFNPQINLEEGILKTYNYFIKNKYN